MTTVGFLPILIRSGTTHPVPLSLLRRPLTCCKQPIFHRRSDSERGWDHGVFIPRKVAYPDATIPVVELSLDHRMDPSQHIAAGQALATLRGQGVLIIGSGMSFHNLSAFGNPGAKAASEQFDSWLTAVAEMSGEVRALYLRNWSSAPSARLCHPREEHLMPLLVAARAATGRESASTASTS
jgi:aromatic ring-opening dioxygenase catalytic subunit (LigB family)